MNSHELNREGRRRVEAELLQRGAASVTSSGTRKACLYATNSSHSRTIDVLVKTKQKGNWHTKAPEAVETTTPPDSSIVSKFWVFVDFSGAPQYWIVPDWWIRNDIHIAHKKYLEKHGGHRARNDNSNHHSIEEGRLEGWQDKWEILGVF